MSQNNKRQSTGDSLKKNEYVLVDIPQKPRNRLNQYQHYYAARDANRERREQLKQREQARGARYTLLRATPLPPIPPTLINNSFRQRMDDVDLTDPSSSGLPIFPEQVPNSNVILGDTQMEDFPPFGYDSKSLIGDDDDVVITKQPGPRTTKGGKKTIRKSKTVKRNKKSGKNMKMKKTNKKTKKH